MTNCKSLLYADDAVIYTSGNDIGEIENSLQQVSNNISNWCIQNRLVINAEKYYNKMTKNYSFSLYKLSKLRKCLSKKTRILIYKQTVLPIIEYADFMLYFCNAKNREKLQRMQNRALRGCLDIYNARDIGTNILHDTVSLDTLSQRRMTHLLNIMYDNRTRTDWHKTSNRDTRNSKKTLFECDIVHLSIYNQSPYFIGANAWNNMPQNLHDIKLKEQFKIQNKEWARAYATN